MFKLFGAALMGATLLATPVVAKPFSEMFPGIYAEIAPDEKAGIDAMDLQTGRVFLKDNIATFDIPEGYYFLAPDDAQFVLQHLWGNPEDPSTLGMLFPADTSPYHSGSWAIEISFDEIGYVSDEDAADYKYDDLLETMQGDTREANKWRTENNYPTIALLGWAAEPRYDGEGRKLHWAKRLKFEGDETETLNYNIRALGRRGVLIVNFIAGMEQLPEVEAALPDVLAMVSFTEGNRYADFTPGADTVAAVGIGGLIAGKVLAKTGFLAVGLIFLKKFWFLLLLPLVGLKRFFGNRNS
ncbi:MAG: DUF2167 domain-containing protein [Albidovulum sp.]